MDKLKNYTPKYPQVTRLSEDDVLLIKEVLEKTIKYHNESHKEAFNILIKKIEGQLELVAPNNKFEFLRDLIKDYVSLTR